jgi:histidine triad (HIT) family protein
MIAKGDIPSNKAYEDEDVLVFHDIHPMAPVHLLIIPKRHIESLAAVTEQDTPLLGKMLALAPKLAAEHGLGNGFKTAINTGPGGGQEVFHLHLHIYGTPQG